MSQATETARGDLALAALRISLLATGATLVGVLAHLAWRVLTQA